MTAPSDRPVTHQTPPAFSRPLVVDDVSDDGLVVSLEANPDECAAVADEIGLPAVGALAARVKIVRLHGGRLRVEGTLDARITQICVVSLDPFDSEVSQPIEMTFAPMKPLLPERHARPRHAREALRRDAETRQTPPPPMPIGDGEADPPDPIVNGRIDLGAVAVEFLTLALDFYPRKPGVHFGDLEIGDTNEPKPSAFAALERFKDRS